MSELTKRLLERVCYASTNAEWPNRELQEAADRIDALEECLREFLAWADAPIGPHDHLAKVINKVRSLDEIAEQSPLPKPGRIRVKLGRFVIREGY